MNRTLKVLATVVVVSAAMLLCEFGIPRVGNLMSWGIGVVAFCSILQPR